MSNVLQFLEAMGRDPALTRLPAGQMAALIDSLEVDEPVREALRRRDGAALGDLLDRPRTLYCVIFAPDEDRPDNDGQGQDSPDRGPEPEDEPKES